MPTPCDGCPNLQPPQLPGNGLFYEVYERVQLCRHNSGALDYNVAMQLMQSMGLDGDETLDIMDKIQAVERVVLREFAEKRKQRAEQEKAKFNATRQGTGQPSKRIGRRAVR